MGSHTSLEFRRLLSAPSPDSLARWRFGLVRNAQPGQHEAQIDGYLGNAGEGCIMPQLYGAAQAVSGPLFTFAAYLGAIVSPSPHGLAGAALGLIAIFLPGMLILMGALPFWERFRKRVGAQAMMRGVNAAVVGLLGAALYNPLWTSSVRTPGDFGIALVGFVLLTVWRAPPLAVVVISALGGIALAQTVSLGG